MNLNGLGENIFFAKVYQMSQGHSAKIVSCAYLDFPARLTNQKNELKYPYIGAKKTAL